MIKNIFKGIKAYSGTFKLISKLGLWKYFGIPIAISIVTATLILVTAYALSDNIGDYIFSVIPWGATTWVRTLAVFFSGLIIIVIGFLVYKHIVMALSAPFMSPVSEKIEAYLTGVENHQHRNTSFKAQLWRGIRINVRNLAMELLLTIPILILSFIPIINIFITFILFLVQSYYAGFGNMDYTLERHFKYGESIDFVKQNKGVAIGNGMVFMLFLLIPVVGIILVLPLSVTAATTETVKLLADKKKISLNEG